MLCDLLSLGTQFDGTITTGATGSNILGIACGRESVVYQITGQSVSMTGGGKVQVLCAGGHSSISKACSILGVGRNNCIDITSANTSASFDLIQLEGALKLNMSAEVASVVVATFGDVNTGSFTTEMRKIADLCTKYKAWLHIDAAFGILARIHPTKSHLCDGLDLADSISFDGHKFFNVPYDCGIFLTRDMLTLSYVCGNTGAAYLSSSTEGYSPLNISLENSRRFRALPLYASLLSLGRDGYVSLVERCCDFATAMGEQIKLSKKFRLLEKVHFNIVLFQAMGYETIAGNEKVKDAINGTGKLYVSGTTWNGNHALRIAVCNYLTPQKAKSEAEEIVHILETAIP
jgi:glutamate/tyrosine decarboxylase-like PLP-dependent enzyme